MDVYWKGEFINVKKDMSDEQPECHLIIGWTLLIVSAFKTIYVVGRDC